MVASSIKRIFPLRDSRSIGNWALKDNGFQTKLLNMIKKGKQINVHVTGWPVPIVVKKSESLVLKALESLVKIPPPFTCNQQQTTTLLRSNVEYLL